MSSCRGVVAKGSWCSSKQTALGLWAISDDRGDYQVVHIQELGEDPDDARQVIDSRNKLWPIASPPPWRGGRCHSLSFAFRRLAFQRRFGGRQGRRGDDVPVFGGTAADNDVTNKWSLFSSKGGVSKNGVVLVLGWSSVEVACYMSSGFQPTERKGVATNQS